MRVKEEFCKLASYLVLLILMVPASGFASTTLHSSAALNTIFKQTDKTYLMALNSSRKEAISQAPEVFALLVGLTIQQQFEQLDKYSNRKFFPHYKVLKDEALNFMGQLAKAHNYQHPIDKTNMPADRLKIEFYNGLNMDASSVRFGNLNPAEVNLPFILSQVKLPDNTGDDGHGKLVTKPKNEIKILGQVAPPAKHSYTPTSNDGKFPPADVILGTWYDSTNNDRRLTFRQKGNNYVAVNTKYLEADYGEKKYKHTIVYTVYGSRERGDRLFGNYRVYSVKAQYYCTPQVKTWECNQKDKDTTIEVKFSKESGYYFISITDDIVLSGYRKI